MELRDKNGLTEAEFLKNYRQGDYPRPSLTADLIILRMGAEPALLLIKRGGHPCLGSWALPGGFVEQGEDALTAAKRELREETGLEELELAPVGFYSTPGRDPRGWVVSAAFLNASPSFPQTCAGDDASDAAWFTVQESESTADTLSLTLTHGGDTLTLRAARRTNPITGRPEIQLEDSQGIAFDHAQMIADAWLCLP